MKKSRMGKLIYNEVVLAAHEYATVLFFIERGYDIELIVPSNSPRIKMPDLLMSGLTWEMKSPQGKGNTTIEHVFKKAAKQSENIIIDLRRMKRGQESNAVRILKRRFAKSTRVKRLYIIKANGDLEYLAK